MLHQVVLLSSVLYSSLLVLFVKHRLLFQNCYFLYISAFPIELSLLEFRGHGRVLVVVAFLLVPVLDLFLVLIFMFPYKLLLMPESSVLLHHFPDLFVFHLLFLLLLKVVEILQF